MIAGRPEVAPYLSSVVILAKQWRISG